MKYDYDLFVIGAGSGGVRAARIASLAGARVAIAEEYRIGGTCVIRGCVPKKLLVYGAEFAQHLADAPGYGWTVGDASFNWPTLRDNVQKEVTRLSGIYTIESREGRRHRVRGARRARRCAHRQAREVRQRAHRRAHPDRHRRPPLSTRRAARRSSSASRRTRRSSCQSCRERVLIVGGGYVALEFANIFSRARQRGAHRASRRPLLRGFDDDLRAHMHIEVGARRHRSSR